MRVLKGESCPKCGGILSFTSSTIRCLGPDCDFTRQVFNKKQLIQLEAIATEVGNHHKVTTAGETLLNSDIHQILDIRRLLQNRVEGYELRDKDKLILISSGFLKEV